MLKSLSWCVAIWMVSALLYNATHWQAIVVVPILTLFSFAFNGLSAIEEGDPQGHVR
ncbi:MAG: hypothetical protein ABIS86_07775 [Streptosporangiaceae bacterium]